MVELGIEKQLDEIKTKFGIGMYLYLKEGYDEGALDDETDLLKVAEDLMHKWSSTELHIYDDHNDDE